MNVGAVESLGNRGGSRNILYVRPDGIRFPGTMMHYLLKRDRVPDRPKSWKFNFGEICKIYEILFRNFLATESVKGTNACDQERQNT